jgi:hypothetical protein
MTIMCIEIVEVKVKCRVPNDELEEHIYKLRRGEIRLPIPAEFICKDAWACTESVDQESTIIYAGYR